MYEKESPTRQPNALWVARRPPVETNEPVVETVLYFCTQCEWTDRVPLHHPEPVCSQCGTTEIVLDLTDE